MMDRKCGLIFSQDNKDYCKARGLKSDAEKIAELSVPWDATQSPEIIQFAGEWAHFLVEEAECMGLLQLANIWKPFWKVAKKFNVDIDGLFGTTQMQNDCAAWSASRCYTALVLHQILRQSEQVPERVNQMALYAYSADSELEPGQRIPNRGRTLDAVARASCAIGNAPTSEAGSYDGSVVYSVEMDNAKTTADKRQMGWALYEQESTAQTVDDIFLSCRAGYPVLIGNQIAVQDGTSKDSNGVYVGSVSGRGWGGGHATCFLEWQNVNGTEYVWWANSHGNIYQSPDGSPDWGCWLTRDSVKKLAESRYFDIIFSTWAEAKRSAPNYNLNI